MVVYGYGRVSSRDQNEQRQIEAFLAEGMKSLHRHIFEDVYPFAGRTRTVQIYKAEAVLGGDRIRYSQPAKIEGHAENVISKMNGINWMSLSLASPFN